MGERICSVPECEAQPRARGMCSRHYHGAWKRGELLPLRQRQAPELAGPGQLACEHDGCGTVVLSRGLCARHYGRAYRRGDLAIAQPTLPIDRHSLSAIDRQARQAHCSICGPGSAIRVKSNGKAECHIKKRETEKRRTRRLGGKRKRVHVRATRREQFLKYTYGISESDYERMAEAQGGACAICRKPAARKLFVDHCHKTGRVRGLLCHPCNIGLGWFRDDAERIARAIDYLS